MHETIKDGSVRQLWKIFVPLSISMFSTFAMLFADRLLLSRYSAEALTAATSGGTLNWMITGMFVSIAGVAGIFVAQYNGAKKYQKLANPVWQMIYFGIGSTVFFCVGAPVIIKYIYTKNFITIGQKEFLHYSFLYAPLLLIYTAINAFYIGQGKTNLIKWVGVIGNGINVGLDYVFIFGIKDFIQPMGIKGAAFATGISIAIQIGILSKDFLSKENIREFGTNKIKFIPSLFFKCLKKGSSSAATTFFELMGWSAYYIMISKTGSEQALIASIEQAIFLFFLFMGSALEKAAGSVSGNLIGAKKIKEIGNLLKSGIKLSVIFGVFVIIFLTIFSDFIVNTFINTREPLSLGEINGSVVEYLIKRFHVLMPILGLYVLTENVRYLITGILISAGDTFFTMVVNTITIWLFMVLPTYYFMLEKRVDIVYALVIFVIHSTITSAILYARFLKGKYIKSI